ncbi:MAG: NAD-dependent epimerase/dehydratase family protein [Candidatus Aminicenantaceae bacterium]
MRQRQKKILVTGAAGQIGSELILKLREQFEPENVIASDIKKSMNNKSLDSGPYEIVDVTSRGSVESVVEQYQINTIYHLAAILSASGEKYPLRAWDVNTNGLYNVLEVARERKMVGVFVPSSIAVFGAETPKENVPQNTILKPSTIYGITKVIGELMGDYYFQKYGLDVRGLRYPGLISNVTLPGGGTTDYAVEIFYKAVKGEKFVCFLNEKTVLPMMYMPDAIKATIHLMEAQTERLKHRSNYNISAMSFSVKDLESEIRKHIPEFKVSYEVDQKYQNIADSWPNTIDDSVARKEWDWSPDYDLASMVKDMIGVLSKRKEEGNLE